MPEKITYEEWKKIEVRIGRILSAEKVSETDTLLKLSVDVGEDVPRTIVSGIARYFTEPGALIGKHVAFVVNLEPKMLRGIESNGMILAASNGEGAFSLLEAAVPPGTNVN